MNIPSTELAIPTTQQLYEQVMHYTGTNRGNGERIRLDADWQCDDVNNEPLQLRLIQQRGVGSFALYTLRTKNILDQQQSTYRFDPMTNNLHQTLKLPDGRTSHFPWPSATVNHLLYGAFEE